MTRVHPGDQAFDYDSLLGTETEMPFSGTRSFMRRRLTRDLAGVDYAVMGIPYDLSTSGRPGTRLRGRRHYRGGCGGPAGSLPPFGQWLPLAERFARTGPLGRLGMVDPRSLRFSIQ